MDATLHVGGRELFKMTGADGESLTNDTVEASTPDPQLVGVLTSKRDPTVVALDGLAAGKTTVSLTLLNEEGTPIHAPVVLNVTVLEKDVVEVEVEQVGPEVKDGAGKEFDGKTGEHPHSTTAVPAHTPQQAAAKKK